MKQFAAFVPREDCQYSFDYLKIFAHCDKLAKLAKKTADAKKKAELESEIVRTYRHLVLNDLFFIVHFIMAIPGSNHPFVVDRCRDVETGPDTATLDVWSREHFKSTIITKAETIQRMLKTPNLTTGIFSHTRPAAKAFGREIAQTLENNELLKLWFPDVLYMKPRTEAPKWSEDDGYIVKREGFNSVSTLEMWGLSEGIPTGKHFDVIIYDDIETMELVRNPDVMAKVFEQFESSKYLGKDGGKNRVIGTFYHHSGPLMKIKGLTLPDGSLKYTPRIYPATEDGTATGKPVLVSQERVDELRGNADFQAQYLCDPTPQEDVTINMDSLTPVDDRFLPADLWRFMVVDSAGVKGKSTGDDAWAMGVFGVRPNIDQMGNYEVYVLDLAIEAMTHEGAIERIVRMYLEGGLVMRLGIEKAGLSTLEIHVANALRAKNRHVSVEAGNLVMLKHGNRNKVDRIKNALEWPLNNGKWFYRRGVNEKALDRLKTEARKFPHWHDDGLDICAYLYDLVKEFKFGYAHKREPIKYRNLGVA